MEKGWWPGQIIVILKGNSETIISKDMDVTPILILKPTSDMYALLFYIQFFSIYH